MSAIITSNFRFENANNFRGAVADSDNSVYVFVGKSDKWATTLSGTSDAAPTTVNTLVEQNDAWKNMIALKRVNSSDVVNLIRRIDWETGTVYTAWDDADTTILTDITKKFYVLTTEFKVYKCIVSPGTASTIMPTQTNVAPTSEGDGYKWKYMYTVNTVDATKFLVNSYIPVKTIVQPPGTVFATWYAALSADDKIKYDYQEDSKAYAGKIYRYVVTSGGTGYTGTPTATVIGDGTGATATVAISSGSISSVTANNVGSNYNAVSVTISGTGSNAAVRAVLSPQNGHGTDPVSELGGFYVGASVSLDDGSGDFIVENSFRQIGIIKNPYNFGTSTVADADTLAALKQLTLSAVSGIAVGDYITGSSSGAKAYVDAITGDGPYTLKYHQNDKTGYGTFGASESISGSTSGGGTGTISALGNPEVKPFSGKILFLENRAPINRTASQIEDVKIIIEF